MSFLHIHAVIALTARTILLSEPTLLSITGPVVVCGDLHGNLFVLKEIFVRYGLPNRQKYLFLGGLYLLHPSSHSFTFSTDYIERGTHSVEIVVLLFALKVLFPENIFILRGNHESPHTSLLGSFATNCFLLHSLLSIIVYSSSLSMLDVS